MLTRLEYRNRLPGWLPSLIRSHRRSTTPCRSAMNPQIGCSWTTPVWCGGPRRHSLICSLMLLPWIAVLGTTLPQRQLSQHYRLAWTGYDVLLALGLAGTAVAALRRTRLLPIAASATGALLVADAWFDVLTSSGVRDIAEAVAMSVLAELPLAFVCFWLAVHSQDVAEQRLLLLLKGRRDPATANGRVPSRTRDNDDDPLPAGDDTTDAGGRARQPGA